MILDKETLIADNLAFDGSTSVLDLEVVRPGPGEPILLFIQGSAAIDATGFIVEDSTDGTSFNQILKVEGGIKDLLEFRLPSSVKRYINVTLENATAGYWSCGVVLPGNQTSQ